MIYLTDADVIALDIDLELVRQVVGSAFAAYGAGELLTSPKSSIPVGLGHAFQVLSAVDKSSGYAAVKWIGMVPPGGAAAVNINATIILSDVDTGATRCIMDARHATGLRTAAMSAQAVQILARENCSVLGLVGAGTQAQSHLLAIKRVLPKLGRVLVSSRTAASAERLAELSRGLGVDAEVGSTEEVVKASDVIVSTVPATPDFKPIIDPAWVKSGGLAISVEVGRAWIHAGLADMDLTIVDEEKLKYYAQPGNLVPNLEHAQATLTDLVCRRHPGRTSDDQRIMFVTSGSAVADLAIASLIYEQAHARDLGQVIVT
ncbi:ornithine cyclodeaminase family protein [Ottowia thiooxydans]|uniref:Alanine dehydrogenase n=1 Tax=Ottowia thiooxydans TaxID=219182 RepID=A0ABV2Q6Y7_9BURK